jgi:hypothetical protein
MEATKGVINAIGIEANARIAGYEKGLADTSYRVKEAEKLIASWRRAALIWCGAAMALTIVVIVESVKLFLR